MIIFEDWKGESFAFCETECMEKYKAWALDPAWPEKKAEKPQEGVIYGCFFCGCDIAPSDIEWMI